ncbi:SDR family NAD(P)-dependent oxidoreductase [Nonomuraea rubra]|uniref:SDR family NAD(P)-dependent oxidoreductase n=1 Tax=Nonomuraea rubra TaxID=46180 RepID=UPI00360CB077
MTNTERTSVLITGGNKGLGLEAARRLGELGWTIFLGSRDEDRGRAAAGKLAAGGANVVLVPLDVTSDESVAAAERLVREHTDRLDVLINNAGAPGRASRPRRRRPRRSTRSTTPTCTGRSGSRTPSCRCCGPRSIRGS